MIRTSDRINEICDKIVDLDKRETLVDKSDDHCTFDTNGDSGVDSFESGIYFGKRAGDRSIFCYSDDASAYYFIGTEQEIIDKLSGLKGEE